MKLRSPGLAPSTFTTDKSCRILYIYSNYSSLRFVLFLFVRGVCVSGCMCAYVHVGAVSMEVRALYPLELELHTVVCMAAGNQTQVFCKSSDCS